jgi:hypothetical protein
MHYCVDVSTALDSSLSKFSLLHSNTRCLRPISVSRQNPKVHHRIHNSPPAIPILSQVNPLHTPQPISIRSILIPSSHLRLDLPSDLYPSAFPTKILYTFLPSPTCATCTAHLILLDLIYLIISGDKYKLRSFPLCNFFVIPLLYPT